MREIYSVIGDNTQENREWLEKVGYKVNHSSDDRFLRTYEDGSTKISHFKNWIYEDKQPINCIGNSSLFKAVSAMREDSDYMQWFITDFSNKLIPTEPMYLSENKYFNGVIIPHNNNIYIHEDGFHIGSTGFHKATLTELQEKFKL